MAFQFAHALQVGVDVLAKVGLKPLHVAADGGQGFGNLRVGEQCQQQVLDRQQVVPFHARSHKGRVKGFLQVIG